MMFKVFAMLWPRATPLDRYTMLRKERRKNQRVLRSYELVAVNNGQPVHPDVAEAYAFYALRDEELRAEMEKLVTVYQEVRDAVMES